MKLTRLQPRPNKPPAIEIEPEFLFASTVLVHIDRLPEVRVLAKRSWAMSDTFEAVFEYRGHRFLMSLPFGSITIEAEDASTPRELIEELAAHIDRYRTVWPTQWLWAIARYFFLPFKLAPPG